MFFAPYAVTPVGATNDTLGMSGGVFFNASMSARVGLAFLINRRPRSVLSFSMPDWAP